MLIILLGTHLFFTFFLHFPQRFLFQRKRKQKKTAFKGFAALTTALAATLGTGNIVGVSSAIALGGPGAVFWCFLTGLFGMATSYAESYLCMKYRRNQKGESPLGGIMYVLSDALHKKRLGRIFAYLLLIASLSIGCSTQAGTVTETVTLLTGCAPVISSVLLVFFVGYVILHGSTAITKLCSVLVPIMGVFYFFSCLVLLFLNINTVVPAIRLILASAFTKKAALSGIAGGAFLRSARYGIARGLFTNEAGIGTAPLAFVQEAKLTPSRAAVLSMSAVFFDTVILCVLTGVVIISSLLKNPFLATGFTATTLTTAAFSVLPFGKELLSISLIAFAYATLVGWSFFGAQSVLFLFNRASLLAYRLCYLFMVFIGSLLSLPLIFELTDLCNACMIVPNVIALFAMRKEIASPFSKKTTSACTQSFLKAPLHVQRK